MKDHKLVPMRPPEEILAVVRKAYGNATVYDVGHVWHEIYKRLPDAVPQAQPAMDEREQFNAAIDFAIQQGMEAAIFLDAWRHGDTSEWPEFQPPQAQQPAQPLPCQHCRFKSTRHV